jgi:hypothetical protein
MNEFTEEQESSPSKSITEYQYLRLEAIERIKLRQQITIGTLILAATLLGIGVSQPKIALIYPPLIVFLALAWAQNDYSIHRISYYIRTHFENLNPERYGWENYVASKRLNRFRVVVLSHNGLFIITQIMAIIIGSLNSNTTTLEFWLLITLDMIGIILILLIVKFSQIS